MLRGTAGGPSCHYRQPGAAALCDGGGGAVPPGDVPFHHLVVFSDRIRLVSPSRLAVSPFSIYKQQPFARIPGLQLRRGSGAVGRKRRLLQAFTRTFDRASGQAYDVWRLVLPSVCQSTVQT